MDAYHFCIQVEYWPSEHNVFGIFIYGLTFAHTATPRPRHDCTTVTCFNFLKICHFNYECPERQSSSLWAASATIPVTSEEDTAPLANSTGNTGFNNLNIGQHSDSDIDSNLEFSFLVNNNWIPSSWILLDNLSTVDVFHNPQLLTNIRQLDKSMDIHCNTVQQQKSHWGLACSWISSTLDCQHIIPEKSSFQQSCNGQKQERQQI